MATKLAPSSTRTTREPGRVDVPEPGERVERGEQAGQHEVERDQRDDQEDDASDHPPSGVCCRGHPLERTRPAESLRAEPRFRSTRRAEPDSPDVDDSIGRQVRQAHGSERIWRRRRPPGPRGRAAGGPARRRAVRHVGDVPSGPTASSPGGSRASSASTTTASAGAADRRGGRPAPSAWWIGVLFMIGSACFALGALPGYVALGRLDHGRRHVLRRVDLLHQRRGAAVPRGRQRGSGRRRPVGAPPRPVLRVAAAPHRLVGERGAARRHHLLQHQHLRRDGHVARCGEGEPPRLAAGRLRLGLLPHRERARVRRGRAPLGLVAAARAGRGGSPR